MRERTQHVTDSACRLDALAPGPFCMLDLIPRIVAYPVPVTAQTAPGVLSAPRAVYTPLLTPQKYTRESGKTYGHRRLMFSLLVAGYEVILAAELFSTVVLPRHRLGKDKQLQYTPSV